MESVAHFVIVKEVFLFSYFVILLFQKMEKLRVRNRKEACIFLNGLTKQEDEATQLRYGLIQPPGTGDEKDALWVCCLGSDACSTRAGNGLPKVLVRLRERDLMYLLSRSYYVASLAFTDSRVKYFACPIHFGFEEWAPVKETFRPVPDQTGPALKVMRVVSRPRSNFLSVWCNKAQLTDEYFLRAKVRHSSQTFKHPDAVGKHLFGIQLEERWIAYLQAQDSLVLQQPIVQEVNQRIHKKAGQKVYRERHLAKLNSSAM